MPKTIEYLDLVNEKDEVIGKMLRSEIYAKKLSNYRVVNGFLRNSKNELWIPLRTATKRLFPSHLDASIGGHAESGESYLDGFKRETMEELRIDIEKTPYTLLGKLNPLQHHVSAFMTVYEIKTDTAPNFNPNDFIRWKWVKPMDLIQEITQGAKAKPDLPKLVKHFYG